MSKAKYDPLEAAKVAPDGGKVTKPDKAFEDAPPLPSPPLAAPRAPESVAAIPVRPKFVVTETCKVSVNGQVVTMEKGRVLDSAGYGGDAGIARLVAQGLKLSPA